MRLNEKDFIGKECLIFTDYNKVFEVVVDGVDKNGYYVIVPDEILKSNLENEIIEKLNLELDGNSDTVMFIPRNRVLFILYGKDRNKLIATSIMHFPNLEKVFVKNE